MRPIKIGEIAVGQPLPYSVLDNSGTLLLKAGCIISDQRQLDRLVNGGVFHDDRPSSSRPERPRPLVGQQPIRKNVFVIVDEIKAQLREIFDSYKAGTLHDKFSHRIKEVAFTLQEASELDSDAVLANLHLDYETTYPVVHAMQVAMISELVGKMLDLKTEERRALIAAALTHDIGLLDIQDVLDRQFEPLTAEQKARISAHTEDGVKLLQIVGVTDPAWLEVVGQHHERLDGSGYPNKLIGDNVKLSSRILAVADSYAAMVRERPYRKAMLSKEAMRSMLLDNDNKLDRKITERAIKAIGIFPPGALVKLASREVGVVKRRQANSTCPVVFVFISGDGILRQSLAKRDTENKEFSIEGILNFSNYKDHITMIRDLWVKSI